MQLPILPLLAFAPSLAASSGTLGFALGNKKTDGTCKFQPDWEADFSAINTDSGSKVVRIYAASDRDTAKSILPAAEKTGGQYAPQYKDKVYAITVGSETLYRGNFTGETLLAKIKDTKSAVGSGFKVSTAESWNKFMDGTADALITGGADILLCDAFFCWQGQPIGNATASFFDDITQAFGHIQSVAGSAPPELWVGETGWPSAGSTYQNAVPDMTSAKTYWDKAICGILAWGVNVFFFEAFDEPWKPVSVGQDGSVADETHWGAWN
ncbi:glucan 1,3-beta-glucosidase [Coleophoma crateriformis]|uniref:glucan 1,3-beta-glucosidase n=1 Tax=Coleophoma crateriformis TaxID=565419 RepID=A0A3D8QZL2_9HELO|nr:glucan 1,3-beta-glucosidase [Coleophoma crateriformis]